MLIYEVIDNPSPYLSKTKSPAMKSLFILCTILIITSCHTGQSVTTPEKTNLLIMLKENSKPASIINDYSDMGLTSLKEANRSQPLYSAQVNLPKTELNQLLKKLSEDPRIVSADIQGSPSPNTNSTNSGFGKSKPQ